MSLNITNTPITTMPAKAPADIKANVMAKLESREERVTNHVQNTFDKAADRLTKVEQFAQDNDYSHLAAYAGKAGEAAAATAQRVTEQVGQRFDVAEKLLMERPEGGYAISQETADTMSDDIMANSEARLASIAERNTNMNERLDALQSKAIDNGLEGDRIDALRERVESRLEASADRVESRTEKAVELVQSRVVETYDTPLDIEPVDNETGEEIDLEA